MIKILGSGIFFFVVSLFFFTSCISNKAVVKDIVIFPTPPDTVRIQFLRKISSSQDIALKRNWFAKFLLGEAVGKPLNKPYGVAIHKGVIYVTDSYYKGFAVIDLEKNTFDYFVPSGLGQLKEPINCFIDEDGVLYVADAGRSQIVVFDENRNYITSFGSPGKFKPTDVFIYDNKIWVANIADHKIHVYSKDTSNKLLFSFPKSENDSIKLYSPTNIFVTKNKVYVSELGDFQVKTFTHDGTYLNTIGQFGDNPGQLSRPKGIAVDRDSNLYVVDAAFENVQIFNDQGKLLMFFGGPYRGPGYMWLPAKVVIDYDNLKYFEKYVDPAFDLKYLIFVTNQFGPDKLGIYGYVEPSKSKLRAISTPKK